MCRSLSWWLTNLASRQISQHSFIKPHLQMITWSTQPSLQFEIRSTKENSSSLHHGVTVRWKDRIKKLDENINWKPPTSKIFTWSCHVDQAINLVLPYIMTPRVGFMHRKNNCVTHRALAFKSKVQWVCMPAKWWCIVGTVSVSGTLYISTGKPENWGLGFTCKHIMPHTQAL